MEPFPDDPSDPIAAVTHRDPYPYYARLAVERPIYHDGSLGLWVAASAEAVTAVLASDLCRVRPPAEPVPAKLQGTAAGDLFGRLVRQNDGDRHGPLKQAVSAALGTIDGQKAAAVSQAWARTLAAGIRSTQDLQDFIFKLSVYVVASLLGVPRDLLEPAARWTGEMAAGFAPSATPEQVERGSRAAAELRQLIGELTGDGVLADLSRQAHRAGSEDVETIAANGAGFLLQTYEATAGLIGNTLLALARNPGLHQAGLDAVIEEVLRRDPPVQNTRRFVARAGTVAGREMREGDAVLVVLAAANRDPAAPSLFSFGAGRHACPGQALATTIARAGVEQALAAGVDPAPLAEGVSYRPSANVRIPLFRVEEGRRLP
ncbi:MAG: cytochrome [Acidobacteria bacterium]|nr:MAG: cytochrome [Acidobacteriota bacterium]